MRYVVVFLATLYRHNPTSESVRNVYEGIYFRL